MFLDKTGYEVLGLEEDIMRRFESIEFVGNLRRGWKDQITWRTRIRDNEGKNLGHNFR